jgi:hypothetical protein
MFIQTLPRLSYMYNAHFCFNHKTPTLELNEENKLVRIYHWVLWRIIFNCVYISEVQRDQLFVICLKCKALGTNKRLKIQFVAYIRDYPTYSIHIVMVVTVATANDKPQEKLTLKFHSVLCTVRHRHGMTPQLCGTAALVYKWGGNLFEGCPKVTQWLCFKL